MKSALSEIVKYEFLTHRLNFGTGYPFSEGSGSVSVPLYKVCHRKTSRHATLSKRDFSTKGDYCEIFENTYFEQHLQAAASEQLIQVLSILKFSRNSLNLVSLDASAKWNNSFYRLKKKK